jgi:sulfate adenylyltransferase
MGTFKEPHGGELKDLYLPEALVADEKRRSRDLPSWDLTMRQVCDIELLLNGGFSPLEGFQDEKDYRNVLDKMRLPNGTIWPIPITLDVTEAFAQSVKVGAKIALRDAEGVLIATMEISSIYQTGTARRPAHSWASRRWSARIGSLKSM